MRNFLFIIIVMFLCVGCRSSRQETSSSLTELQLEEMITKRLTQFHTSDKVTDIHRRDSMTVVITEYNAPDSTGRQSKKKETVISSGSQTATSQKSTDSIATITSDSTYKKEDIHQMNNTENKTIPVPWYAGFEYYIAFALIIVILYLLKHFGFIKL